MKPAEKNCLIARSKCYLQLGEPENALADANETLKDDKKYIKVGCMRMDVGQVGYSLYTTMNVHVLYHKQFTRILVHAAA